MNQRLREKIKNFKDEKKQLVCVEMCENRNEELRKIRKSLNFTQQEMANFLDVSISGYNNWENGRRNITNLTWQGIMRKVERI